MAETTVREKQYLPHERHELAIYLLIASFAVFFTAMLLMFAIRFIWFVPEQYLRSPKGIPSILYVSTAVLLMGSACVHTGLRQIRQEKQQLLRLCLVAGLILGVLFCILQTFGLSQLLEQHYTGSIAHNNPFAFIFVMVVFHALHFIGGLVGLIIVMFYAYQQRYDHEYHGGIKLVTTYWHFMDLVWVVMLVLMFFSL